eukprot:CFRG2165T1
MMNCFQIALFFVTVISVVHETDAHAYLTNPPSNQALARERNQEYCPHCYSAGGVGTVQALTPGGVWPYPETEASSVRHGLCGDPANAVETKYMPGDVYNDGLTHADLISGQDYEFEVLVSTHHRGHYEFRVCDFKENGNQLTQTCLNEHLLLRADGDDAVSSIDPDHPERYYLEPTCANPYDIEGNGVLFHHMKYHIPDSLQCEFCIVQWVYVTANSCNPPGYHERSNWPTTYGGCAGDGPGSGWWGTTLSDCGVGTGARPAGGYPEEFWNCANVRILDGNSNGNSSVSDPPTTDPTGTPITDPTETSTTDPPNTNPDLVDVQYTWEVVNAWTGACTVEIKVLAPFAVDGWMLLLQTVIPTASSFSQMWNAIAVPELSTSSELVIKNEAWNGKVSQGTILSFGGNLNTPGSSSCGTISSILLYNMDGLDPAETTAPVDDPPVDDPPVDDPPVDDPPVDDPPVDDPPVDDPPVDDPPVDDPPVDDSDLVDAQYTWEVVDAWTGACTVEIKVLAPFALDGWMLLLQTINPADSSFSQVWNAIAVPELSTSSELVVKNEAWNGQVSQGMTISFGGSLNTPGSSSCGTVSNILLYNMDGLDLAPPVLDPPTVDPPIDDPVNGPPVVDPPVDDPPPADSEGWISADFQWTVSSVWSGGCSIQAIITAPMDLNGWVVGIDELTPFGSTIGSVWDATEFATDNPSDFIFTDVGYNSNVGLGQQISFGATLTTPGSDQCASVKAVYVGHRDAAYVQFPGDDGSVDNPQDDPVEDPVETPPVSTPTSVIPTDRSTISCPKFRSSGGKIQANGQDIVLKGTSWFGFETYDQVPHGCWGFGSGDECWQFFFGFLKTNEFNALRIPMAMDLVETNPITQSWPFTGLRTLDVMEQMVDQAGAHGIVVMFDLHVITPALGITELWYDESLNPNAVDKGSAEGTERIKRVVNTLWTRFGSKWNVFALDVKNEPHGVASWGTGDITTDWKIAAQSIAQHIIDTTIDWLVFVEGVENNAVGSDPNDSFWWGGNLEGVTLAPVVVSDPERLVYSPHVYGPSVFNQPYFSVPDFPTNLVAIYEQQFGFVAGLTGRAVVIGEWGGRYEGADKQFQDTLVAYMVSRELTSNFYWCLNPNSLDTGGLLQNDWRTPEQSKLDMLAAMIPSPPIFECN